MCDEGSKGLRRLGGAALGLIVTFDVVYAIPGVHVGAAGGEE